MAAAAATNTNTNTNTNDDDEATRTTRTMKKMMMKITTKNITTPMGPQITQFALRNLRNAIGARTEISPLCSSEHRVCECTSMKFGRVVISAVLI